MRLLKAHAICILSFLLLLLLGLGYCTEPSILNSFNRKAAFELGSGLATSRLEYGLLWVKMARYQYPQHCFVNRWYVKVLWTSLFRCMYFWSIFSHVDVLTVQWHKYPTATYFTSIWKPLFLTWIVEQNKPVIKYKHIWIPFQEGLPLQKLCLYSTPKWIIPLKVYTLQMHCASWINAQEEMSCSLLIADLLEKDGKWYDVHYN